jgi:hypothetical protein
VNVVWVLLSVLVRALWRVLSQVALRILPGLLRAVVVALAVAAVLSLPVVVMVLVHFVKGPPEAEQCSTSTMATRPPDHAAADRLSRALDRLAGVTATNVEFDDALWPAHAPSRSSRQFRWLSTACAARSSAVSTRTSPL